MQNIHTSAAGLMAVVLIKLFLVDVAGVNTGARVVSFLGVGGLLLLLGYLAPQPPKTDACQGSH